MYDLNPFEFGIVVTGKYFTDRKAERDRLTSNFRNRTNTILISPRRWGKSSLVKEVSIETSKRYPDIKFCFIDMFNIRSELAFYEILTAAIINATSDKLDEARQLVRQAFKTIVPKFNLSVGDTDEISVGFELKEVKKNADEILNFAEKVAARKKIRLVLCIDEFQNLEFFEDALAFQKKLRSHWQHHRHVSYCLYGSKRHMMINLFSKLSMPFYRFGDIVFLEKIDTTELEKFIMANFKKTGRLINSEQCIFIIEKMKNHPYYVQQLSHIVWNHTEKTVTKKILEDSIDDLLNQNAILYQRDTDNLSNTQIGLLKAIASGTVALSSADSIREFGLGSSASVKKNKTALEKKEIIDLFTGAPSFLDPAFELWFKRNFMGMPHI